MPLVTAPLFTLNSQYRPNIFLLSMTSANPLVLAQASIVVNGSGVTSISKSTTFEISGTYYFEFDVSKILQLSSAPKAQDKSTIFPNTLNIPYNIDNTDSHTEVGLIVSYYYNDPITGLLTQYGTIDTIPFGYPAINGTRQTKDWNNMGLDDYIMQLYNNSPFLTNAPQFYKLCREENHYISFVQDTSDTVRVITQDSSGAGIDDGLFAISPNIDLVPTTIGVGVPNLNGVTYFSGSVNINNPNIAQYQIIVGNSYAFGGGGYIFVATSEIRVFGLIECCSERTLRLHWMNRLGGIDAYTFRSKKTITEKNKSEIAQKPITSWGYSLPVAQSYDKGKFKINNNTFVEYEAESTFYTEEEGAWIAELLSSPEVYLETDYGLVSVVITDSNIKLVENDELLNITITFIESNNVSTQSN